MSADTRSLASSSFASWKIGDLVELQLAAYPHTDWLVGVDLLWPRRPGSGVAERWLKARLMQSKVFELDAKGQATTL